MIAKLALAVVALGAGVAAAVVAASLL